MDDKKKLVVLGIVVVVAVVAAIFMGTKSMSGSGETVTNYKEVPPKGAGKFDRD